MIDNNAKNTIQSIIDQKIEELKGLQQKNGSFLSFTSSKQNDWSNAVECPSIFSSALILISLSEIGDDNLARRSITKNVTNFLQKQKSKYWTYNYWVKESEWHKNMPYPDDLDDTSCALTALYKYDKKTISGDVLANFVKILTSLEKKEGGPYRTWLANEQADKAWRDVDLAVNANIAHFLSLFEINLEGLDRFIDNQIKNDKIKSPYYIGNLPIIYFISKSYKGKLKKILIRKINSNRGKDSKLKNPLASILAVTSLINLGADPKTLINDVKHLIENSDKLCEYPFYVGINPRNDSKKYYAGSKSLTTALYIECLNLYLKNSSSIESKLDHVHTKENQQLADKVFKNVTARTNSTIGQLKKMTVSAIKKIMSKDTDHQIALMPHHFFESLKCRKTTMNNKVLINLCTANVLGWISYTIFDDFLDEEGDLSSLPIAMLCNREMNSIFQTVAGNLTMSDTIWKDPLTITDKTNLWEVQKCRLNTNEKIHSLKLPSYTNLSALYKRSLGHLIAPMMILESTGYGKSSKEFKETISMLSCYIIARQISDDQHDWKDDLKKGQINYVANLVLQYIKKEKKHKSLTIKNAGLELDKAFSYYAIIHSSEKGLSQIRKSIKLLRCNELIKEKTYFYELFEKIEQSFVVTLEEQKNIKKFVDTIETKRDSF